MPALVIPAQEHSPALHVHGNPLHNLYHYLAREAQRPREERNPATAAAAALMAEVRFPRDVQGLWSTWERPLTTSGTPEEAVRGLTQTMTETADQLGEALRQAESVFRETLWPQRLPKIEAALATLREHFAPHFPAMARGQAALLDLAWPSRIDAFLVTDCYAREGAYSHPLTVGVSQHTGIMLCETLLHEATHVGDVHANIPGKERFGGRLQAYLTKSGLCGRDTWNVWHAVIFAASAEQVRACIAPEHTDYAIAHDLYAYFKVPHLPALWAEFASGVIDEQTFLERLAGQVGGG